MGIWQSFVGREVQFRFKLRHNTMKTKLCEAHMHILADANHLILWVAMSDRCRPSTALDVINAIA